MRIKKKVDMHMHTSASDGTWTPQKLVQNIIQEDIKVFSVTDHDTVKNVPEILALADSHKGLTFIPGVEVSATFKGKTYHILGYGIDPSNDKLNTFIDRNRKIQSDTNDKNVAILGAKYTYISLPEYANYKYNPARGGWKSINYLMDKSFCKDYREFYKIAGEVGISLAKAVFPQPYEAVEIISQAGGIPVLAHPGADFYDRDFRGVVNGLFEEGIKGIECFHPENSSDVTDYCLDFCRSNQLLITGGSDCHGDFIESRKIGSPDIILEQLCLASLLE